MARLTISCLGTFQVKRDGTPVTHFRSANVQALLVYLALQGRRPFPRDVLAALFWPDEPDSVARTNLRQSLYQLRKTLGDGDHLDQPFLLINRQTVQFNRASDHWLDVAAFLTDLDVGKLETAVAHYQGDLLPGFDCDSLEFEAWLRREREHLHGLVMDALTNLTARNLAQADFAAAQIVAHRQLALEPWHEIAHQQLMQALALSGYRRAALAQYQLCQAVLEEELGAPPAPETTELWERIQRNEFTLSAVNPFSRAAAPPPFQAPPLPAHFVGREAELARIAAWLTAPRDQVTLVALVGMGGAGKSTLAARLAHQLRDEFADGVLWGNPHTSEVGHILEVWGRAYGHDYSSLPDLNSRATAVRGLLAHKQALIVLDNVDDAALARPLLPGGAGCVVIVTTRSREAAAALNAQSLSLSDLSPDNSLDMLVHIVGAARVTAPLSEKAAAAQIGQLLHHLPLAVEIAAQLLQSRPRMKVAAMAARLQDAQERLGLEISDRAVRASFAVSWEVLAERLRRVFAAMAAFGGRPFAPEALAAVVDGDLYTTEDALYALHALSLVQAAGEERYKQHPLLADFAAEKLVDKAGVNGRYTAYYLNFAQVHHNHPGKLEPEWENIAAAVQAAHEAEDWARVLDLTEALAPAWFQYGRYTDAQHAYALAETAARTLGDDRRLAHTLLRWAEICLEQSDYDAAWARLETSLHLFSRLEDGEGIVQAHYFQGFVLYDQGEYRAAEQILQKNLKLLAQFDNQSVQAATIRLLARVYFETDETMARAEETAVAALHLQEALPSATGLTSVLRLLANIQIRKNKLDAAQAYASRAAEVSLALQNPAEKGAANYLLMTIFQLQKQYERAETLALDSLRLFQGLGNRRYESMVRHELSVNYLANGRYDEAWQHTEESLAICRQIEDRLGYGYAMRQKGDILLKLERREEALRAWQEAQALAEFLGQKHLLGQLQQRLHPRA
jgi:DNA-binding SARP family transcriptional activator/tetratricopeptide (TPR) repeat protein